MRCTITMAASSVRVGDGAPEPVLLKHRVDASIARAFPAQTGTGTLISISANEMAQNCPHYQTPGGLSQENLGLVSCNHAERTGLSLNTQVRLAKTTVKSMHCTSRWPHPRSGLETVLFHPTTSEPALLKNCVDAVQALHELSRCKLVSARFHGQSSSG